MRPLRLPLLARARPTFSAVRVDLERHHHITSFSHRPRHFSISAPIRSGCAADSLNENERWPDSLVTLAIETSCDDTCVAILEKEKKSSRPARSRLLFEERITADNRVHKGIHPLTAATSHTAALGRLVKRALPSLPVSSDKNDKKDRKVDFVSVTRGSGMQASLVNGLSLAKGLAVAWDVPLVGVHHMQAHSLTPRLVASLEQSGFPYLSSIDRTLVEFPYLSFLVSGGHTLLVHSRSLCDHRVLAAADNIAIGDILDKCARALLPQGYIEAAEAAAGRSLPFGALLESYTFANSDYNYQTDYKYPRKRCDEMVSFQSDYGWSVEPALGSNDLRKALRFNFSGLNGQVQTIAEGFTGDTTDAERRLLARATMHQAFEHLASRLLLALKSRDAACLDSTALVVSGGVASNKFLRHVLRSALDVHGFGGIQVVAPPAALCTDNAAMIAWAGMEMYEAGYESDLGIGPMRRWSMDPTAADGGIIGIGGWIERETI